MKYCTTTSSDKILKRKRLFLLLLCAHQLVFFFYLSIYIICNNRKHTVGHRLIVLSVPHLPHCIGRYVFSSFFTTPSLIMLSWCMLIYQILLKFELLHFTKPIRFLLWKNTNRICSQYLTDKSIVGVNLSTLHIVFYIQLDTVDINSHVIPADRKKYLNISICAYAVIQHKV